MGFVPFVPFPSLTSLSLFIPVALLPSVLSSNLGGKVAGPGATFSKSAQKKPPKSPWVGLMRMQWLNAARACQSIAIALHALRVATNYRFMLRPLKIWKKIHLRKCRFWSFLVWNWDLTTSTHVALTDGKCWCLLCAHGVSHPDPHFPPPWSTLHVRLRIARGKHGGCQRTTIATPKALWVLWHSSCVPKLRWGSEAKSGAGTRHVESPLAWLHSSTGTKRTWSGPNLSPRVILELASWNSCTPREYSIRTNGKMMQDEWSWHHGTMDDHGIYHGKKIMVKVSISLSAWTYSYGSVSKPCTPGEHQNSW